MPTVAADKKYIETPSQAITPVSTTFLTPHALHILTPNNWHSNSTDFTTSSSIPHASLRPLIVYLPISPCLRDYSGHWLMVTIRTGVTKAGLFDTPYIQWHHWLLNPSNGTPSTLEATSRRRTTRIITLTGLQRAAGVDQGQNWSFDLCYDAKSKDGNYHFRW